MLALVRAGARVRCIQATDGSDSAALAGRPEPERRTIRLAEAAAVAQAMGGVELECWGADNRAFRADPALVDRLAARLERDRPSLVLAPFVNENHRDHVTLVRILARALEALTPPLEATILSYEVWSLVPASLVHDLSPVMRELEELLFTYETAMKVDDFVHFCADRALYHGITLRGAARPLEAFHAVAARDYPALARAARSFGDD
jgi:LmbE family N-acetylglucosaminyl deacetylase